LTVRVSYGEIEQLEKRGDTGALLTLLIGDELRGSPKLRRKTAIALLRLRDPKSVEVLMRVVRQDPDAQVRRIAMRTLANIGDRATLGMFVETLHSHDINLRLQAIDGLAKSRANEAVRPLIKLLEDSKAAVRAAAARALADLGDEAAIAPIRREMEQAWWRPFHRMRMKLALDLLEERAGRSRAR
jgi:HEAT repeat protein